MISQLFVCFVNHFVEACTGTFLYTVQSMVNMRTSRLEHLRGIRVTFARLVFGNQMKRSLSSSTVLQRNK